jgi:hypothetical protein
VRPARLAASAAVALGLAALGGGCSSFARSSTLSASTTQGTFGSLPPLVLKSTTSEAPGAATASPTTRRGTPTTAGPAATAPPAAGSGARSDIDATPCAHPTDKHAVDRTDPGGLFLRIGAAKNCVAKTDRIEIVVQVGNTGKTPLYVSSVERALVSLVGAGGKAAWSDPCEVKPPPPGGPPDVPVTIEPGKSVELAHVFYDPAKSECGVLGEGRYDGQASVAQCTADDAKDGVCNTPKRIPTDRIGIEVKP